MRVPTFVQTILARTALRRGKALRGLCSVRQFRRLLALERQRSDRSGIRFCLLELTPRSTADRTSVHTLLAKAMRKRLRNIDQAGLLDNHRIGVLLPVTEASGAWKLADDICQTLEPQWRPLCKVFCYPTRPPQPKRTDAEPRRATELEPVVHALDLIYMQSLPIWKRSFDILGAVCGLTVLSPLLLLVAAGIKCSSRGPVLFKQWRSGAGGKPFLMYKFRSMVLDAEVKKAALMEHNERDGPVFKIKADPRVTWFGRLLRSANADELPQLWNVLKGEMSLVGPRPLPCSEADACNGWQRRRLDVTPGLTCLWQVRNHHQVTFDEWVRMDIEYVSRKSAWQDLKILLATIPAVVFRRGS